ncbi:cysteine peptidase family C39 domain-containing protein [Mucilaginibacter lacusdianchii]|uniref:cysteine peptidase family C39 domain-containing protein n=1 Tax=Mucilaginibacter lacusdianchii TaxID=2684211 RepID=UPI00131B5601|nr:cysteine peptidase family C39 domain-containing protein [Mucilaginibacter sp. JXJ CY 39]
MLNLCLIKRSFIRQSAEDDCGRACLAMILLYAGRPSAVRELDRVPVPPGGFSLLELKDLARSHGLDARVVVVDPPALRKISSPCILHTLTPMQEHHFEVCYGGRDSCGTFQYLVADPACQAGWQREEELLGRWPLRAALYFPDISPDPQAFGRPGWRVLWSYRAFPPGLLLSVPVLTLLSAFAGVAVSWTLQKGMSDSAILQGRIIAALLILLLLISFSRILMSYLRQRILLRIETDLQTRLMQLLTERLFPGKEAAGEVMSAESARPILLDIQRVKSALLTLVSVVLPDILSAVFLIAVVTSYVPAAGLVELAYIVLTGLILLGRLFPLSFSMTRLQALHASAENVLVRDVNRIKAIRIAGLEEQRKALHQQNQQLHTALRHRFLLGLSHELLGLEALGACSVTAVWVTGLYQLAQMQISYAILMTIVILSYILTTLVARMQSALLVVAEGTDAALQLQRTLQDSLQP